MDLIAQFLALAMAVIIACFLLSVLVIYYKLIFSFAMLATAILIGVLLVMSILRKMGIR